jgi:SAM-dependent methyltransferase
VDVSTFKESNRAMWASGNYDAVADLIWGAGRRLVERLGIGSGEDVLDVACGTGNAAIPAAEAGAHVVGVDLTPELFAAGGARAAAAEVEIEWVEGDAEALPFADESFDVVLSTFGCMFAPRHQVTAAELVRVLRPGGRLGIASWTPEGSIGDFFRAIAAHLPPPPAFAAPPILWGDADHARSLFAGSGLELELDRDHVEFRFDSVAGAVDYYETQFGPVIKAREHLEAQGRWEEARADLAALYEEHESDEDGSVVYPAEYLVVIARKP